MAVIKRVGDDYNLDLPGHFIRRRIERWLWSGGRFRTWLAVKSPMYFSDVDYIDPLKITCDDRVYQTKTGKCVGRRGHSKYDVSCSDCPSRGFLPPLHGGYKPRRDGRKPVDNLPKPPSGKGAGSSKSG